MSDTITLGYAIAGNTDFDPDAAATLGYSTLALVDTPQIDCVHITGHVPSAAIQGYVPKATIRGFVPKVTITVLDC